MANTVTLAHVRKKQPIRMLSTPLPILLYLRLCISFLIWKILGLCLEDTFMGIDIEKGKDYNPFPSPVM
jgi:hypothetical protein